MRGLARVWQSGRAMRGLEGPEGISSLLPSPTGLPALIFNSVSRQQEGPGQVHLAMDHVYLANLSTVGRRSGDH